MSSDIWSDKELEFLKTMPSCIAGLDIFVKFVEKFPDCSRTLRQINLKHHDIKQHTRINDVYFS